MTQQIGRARAHTNIALIKYWGKKDKELFLPMNSSLSLTLDAFYTDTKVTFDENLDEDVFYLNHILQEPAETEKITRFVDLFRNDVGVSTAIKVESLNFVPTAAGLASSASAFAALSLAIDAALGLQMDRSRLSTYARRGSGSSTRSLFGGFVEWERGNSSETSFAHPVDPADWDIAMLVVVVDGSRKKIASRVGMEHTVKTSPFYDSWVQSAQDDIQLIKEAIRQHDFQKVGELTEHSAMKMHATTLSANPPFTYWTAESLRVQEAVREIRERLDIPAFMTMDAGPNVKILCRASQVADLKQALADVFPKEQLIESGVGPEARLLSEEEWQESLRLFDQRGKA